MERASPPAAYSCLRLGLGDDLSVGASVWWTRTQEAGAAAFEAAGWDGTRGPGLFLVLFLSEAVAKWPRVIV